MNTWERYPAKGTHHEAMAAKQRTAEESGKEYTAIIYRGRDRDDWSYHTLMAWSLDNAMERLKHCYRDSDMTIGSVWEGARPPAFKWPKMEYDKETNTYTPTS